jgi:hypothetical protein
MYSVRTCQEFRYPIHWTRGGAALTGPPSLPVHRSGRICAEQSALPPSGSPYPPRPLGTHPCLSPRALLRKPSSPDGFLVLFLGLALSLPPALPLSVPTSSLSLPTSKATFDLRGDHLSLIPIQLAGDCLGLARPRRGPTGADKALGQVRLARIDHAGIGQGIDQRRLARGKRALQCTPEVLRALHQLAVATQRFDHLVISGLRS